MDFVYIVIFLAFCRVANSTIYRSIIWSPENPVFKETKLRCVLPRSMQYFLCPSLSLIVTDREQQPKKENLYENIWLVDQHSYKTCKVGNTSKLLKKCSTPLTLSRFDILFLDMHPLSGGLEFKFGKSYYIIATSNGTQKSLENKEGGHCRSHSMKMQFYVCKDDQGILDY
ncbi:Ephrin-B1 [Exaiptasia diaphana]|nr:Ephrin-B1 [Exaiptasia diaphana]